MKLVRIDWVDPWCDGGWVNKEEVDETFNRDLRVSSIGWILRENEERILLTRDIQQEGEGDQFGDLFVIPKVVVQKVTLLQETVPL